MEHEFAVYRGEEFLAVGTAKELAAQFNVKPKTIKFWSTPAWARRLKKEGSRAKLTVKLGVPDGD